MIFKTDYGNVLSFVYFRYRYILEVIDIYMTVSTYQIYAIKDNWSFKNLRKNFLNEIIIK